MKVRVSFFDGAGAFESLTSLPFGPVHGRPALLRESTLVANTGQSASAEEEITGQYSMGFRLGGHGQGYEISSVSIELAAAPSSLTVSLWAGGREGMPGSGATSYKLFDFANPSSFRVGAERVHGSRRGIRVPERQLLHRAVGFRGLAKDQRDDV